MKTLACLTILLAAVFVVPARAWADAPSAGTTVGHPELVVYDAASAFEFLKTLTGNWERTGGHDQQNAPVMKFEKSDKPGEIKFVFHGGTNFDPKTDTHVHEGVMRIKDANTIESNFVAYSDGKPGATPKGVLKRKSAK